MPDMAPHHFDPAFNALGLDAPVTVKATASFVDPQVTTGSNLVTYQYDARGTREWGDVDHGHMDIGWVARLGLPNAEYAAMSIRIGQKFCGPDGRCSGSRWSASRISSANAGGTSGRSVASGVGSFEPCGERGAELGVKRVGLAVVHGDDGDAALVGDIEHGELPHCVLRRSAQPSRDRQKRQRIRKVPDRQRNVRRCTASGTRGSRAPWPVRAAGTSGSCRSRSSAVDRTPPTSAL